MGWRFQPVPRSSLTSRREVSSLFQSLALKLMVSTLDHVSILLMIFWPDLLTSCAPPMMPGVYGGEPAIETVIPEIPDILVDLIGAGTYEAKATIKNPDDSEMTCIFINIELA